MEQKQLDEIDESFFGEEIIEDEEPKMKKSNSKSKKSNKMADKKSKEKNKEEPSKKSEAKKEVKADLKVEEKKEEVKIETVSDEKIDPWADEEKSSGSMFGQVSTWQAVAGILAILLIFSIFTYGFRFSDSDQGEAISLSEAEELALEYINSELLQAPFVAELQDSEEMDNVFRFSLSIGGQVIDSYMTKDGTMLFPQGFEVEGMVDTDATSEGNEEDTSNGVDMVSLMDDDAVKGDINAPVTIVEFSDYECPFCGKYVEETMPRIIENYVDTGKVKYVFRDFPLSFHADAQKAGEAAECAGEQDMYWDMHDMLFANQDALDVDSLKSYAEELGLDTESFNSCLDNGDMAEEVEADMADGAKYGVQGTPAFFINGEMVSGAMPYAVFEDAIETALAEASGEDVVEEVEEEELVVEETEEVEEDEVVEETEEELVVEDAEVIVEEETVEEITTATASFSVSAKKWMFSPQQITVSEGDVVSLTIIPESLDFTFALEAFGVEEQVSGTTTIQFTADSVGEYDFTCSSCEDWRGMTGTLVVE